MATRAELLYLPLREEFQPNRILEDVESPQETSPDLTEGVETLDQARALLASPDMFFELGVQLSVKLPYLEAKARIRAKERVFAAVTLAYTDAQKITTMDGKLDGHTYLNQEIPDSTNPTETTPLFYFLRRKFNRDFGFGLVNESSRSAPRRR